MLNGELAKSKHGLLMLTGAIVQLIQASNVFKQNSLLKRETDLLTYHKTKQTKLLIQLHDIIILQISTLSAYEQTTHLSSETEEMKSIQSSTLELLTQFLKSTDAEALPKEQYILSIEQLRDKLLPVLLSNEGIDDEVELDLESDINHEINKELSKEIRKITKNVAPPMLSWIKDKPKKVNKEKGKKDDQSIYIRIGSQSYQGVL